MNENGIAVFVDANAVAVVPKEKVDDVVDFVVDVSG